MSGYHGENGGDHDASERPVRTTGPWDTAADDGHEGGDLDPGYDGNGGFVGAGGGADRAGFESGTGLHEGAGFENGAGLDQGGGFGDSAAFEDQADFDEERDFDDEPDFGQVAYIDDQSEAAAYLARPPGGRRTRSPRRAAEVRRHRLLVGLGLVIAVVLIVGVIGWVSARRDINPPGKPGAVVTVHIPKSASTSDIGKILASAGVIHEARLFPIYTKLTGSSDLLPGTYHLATNESYSGVIRVLQAGPPLVVDKLVIPEGFTLAQIAQRVAALPGLHLSAAKFLAAGTSGQVRSVYEPAGVNNLEGLVFPATYTIRQGQEEADILQEMVNTFEARAKVLGLDAAAAKIHYTPYQVVSVASIVEREAKLDSDRGNVASTLYNRLAHHTPLGADSTQTYYLRLHDPSLEPSVTQLNEPSPYNTRLNPGLPPTPIANPGIPSLEAAMNPPATSYLYFVEINPDGQLGFASDATGFAALRKQCQAAHLC